MHKRGCLRWNINHGVRQLIIAGLVSLPCEAAAATTPGTTAVHGEGKQPPENDTVVHTGDSSGRGVNKQTGCAGTKLYQASVIRIPFLSYFQHHLWDTN